MIYYAIIFLLFFFIILRHLLKFEESCKQPMVYTSLSIRKYIIESSKKILFRQKIMHIQFQCYFCTKIPYSTKIYILHIMESGYA